MRQRSFPLIVLFLALALFVSCASRRTAATLNDVETYIQARPDSALATICAIDTTTLTTRSLRAHYALLYAMALDKNWIDTTDVNIVMPAVEYYDRHPSGTHRAKAWYYLGRIQQNGNNRPDASISFLKAERYAEPFDDTDFKGLICLAMSSIYSQTHLHEEALKYAERAYSLFVSAKDTINASNSLLSKAEDYNNLECYDDADSLYRYLMENNLTHPNLRSELLCSYALLCVVWKEDFEQATQLFEEAIFQFGSLRDRNSWGAYAYALARLSNTERSDLIFRKLAEGNDSSQKYVYSIWKSLSDAYSGDFSSAYNLQKSASNIQDENVRTVMRQSAIKAQKDFLDVVSRESENEAKRRQLYAGIAIAILLIFILFLVIFFKRRSIRSSQEKESLIKTYKELTSRTEEEKAKVRNQYILMCQSHFSHIGRINELLNVYAKESNNNLYKELRKSIQRIGLDEQSQQRFEKMLDDSFDGLMTHFRESFPGKKPRFYQLVSFLFAGFGTTTICTIIPSYNKHNIHVEKWRLKQMIQNSDSSYKEQFLEILL